MKCRNCGAEIADKALICYRCGTATTEAKYRPARLKSRGVPDRTLILLRLVLAVVLVILVAAAAFYYLHGVR
jgi:uncharacterized membrane protein YvbJ